MPKKKHHQLVKVKRKLSLKEKLDEIDNSLTEELYDGFYESRLRIEMGMWRKGRVIELLRFRGVNLSSQPSYYQLEKETERGQSAIKRWHTLYLKHPEKKDYLPIAEEKAKEWTDKVFKKSLPTIDEEEIETPELPEGEYNVIYADPPWQYNVGEQHGKEGTVQETTLSTHYPSISIEKICDLPVPNIVAKDAVLFLWATPPLVWSQEAFQVISSWGFEAKACFVWDKMKHNVGHYNSVRHEFLIIAIKGSYPLHHKKLYPSIQSIKRTKHSAKPEEFRKIIDDIYCKGKRPYIDLFGRGKAPKGWIFWGIEAE